MIVSEACAPVTPGVSGREKGRQAGTGLGQERIDVSVVAAGELHDLRPAGVAASQADGAHGRLGARRHEAHLLDGIDSGHDLLGEFDLTCRRGAEGEALDGGFLHGREHLGAGSGP